MTTTLTTNFGLPKPPLRTVGTADGYGTLMDNADTNIKSKLLWANVKGDFGAKGNNSDDDTAAFQAAINSGAPIYVPSGIYKVNDLVPANGLTMIGAIPLPGGGISTGAYLTSTNRNFYVSDSTVYNNVTLENLSFAVSSTSGYNIYKPDRTTYLDTWTIRNSYFLGGQTSICCLPINWTLDNCRIGYHNLPNTTYLFGCDFGDPAAGALAPNIMKYIKCTFVHANTAAIRQYGGETCYAKGCTFEINNGSSAHLVGTKVFSFYSCHFESNNNINGNADVVLFDLVAGGAGAVPHGTAFYNCLWSPNISTVYALSSGSTGKKASFVNCYSAYAPLVWQDLELTMTADGYFSGIIGTVHNITQ